jgi:O-antigen/teichoic acid export membrane protein
VATTFRNGLKLGGSLLVTVVIGFGVKIALRRFLGPTVIGPVNWADGLSASVFVIIGLGFDTHLRKVVPIDPTKASDFVGTFFVLRALFTALLFGGITLYLQYTNATREEFLLVYAFGASQFVFWLNNTFQAILHSTRTVDALSIINVVSKLVWAAGFIATMVFKLPLIGIPLSVLAGEVLKAIVGWQQSIKHAQLSMRVDWAQVVPVMKASFAFYVTAVAVTILNRFDVNVLKHASNDTEIGLYSSASELSQMTFVLAPMLGGVLMPLFARAHARNQAEYENILRRTLEFMLMLAIPPSLAIAVGSDVWVKLFLGSQYTDAALALRILGPNFLLTYVAMVCAIALNLTGGEWTVTVTSILGMFFNPLMVTALVAPCLALFGTGGAGAAAAFAQVGTELLITSIMLIRMGKSTFDRRSLSMLAKTALVCAIVVLVDRQLLSLGPARLVVDAVVYVVGVLAIGAVKVRETVTFVKQLRRREA